MITYYEDDWAAEVQILNDTSDTKFERYKLKVVKTIESSEIFKLAEDGHIFDVEQRKDCGNIVFELIKS